LRRSGQSLENRLHRPDLAAGRPGGSRVPHGAGL